MRAAFEHVEATQDVSWTCYLRQEPRFPFTWHYHHEYELTLITGGRGTRFVGDSIEDYQPGDLTLIGPDLPHTYASVPDGRQEAVVVQFRGDFLGAGFFGRPEFAAVTALLSRSARGVAFARPEPLTGLLDLPPAERTLSLLRTLVRLAGADGRPLASTHYRPTLNRAAGDRIDAVMELLHARYPEPLTLAEIARAAHMAPAAVSRFFRRTTGATITGYLNGLRISAACRLLVEGDRRIADIAAACGYHNLAHFNRRFLALKGMPPRAYRARFSPHPARPGSPPAPPA
jgi:AraC-like DNA-binding protein